METEEDRQTAEARARAETGYKGRYTDIINIHGGLPPSALSAMRA